MGSVNFVRASQSKPNVHRLKNNKRCECIALERSILKIEKKISIEDHEVFIGA